MNRAAFQKLFWGFLLIMLDIRIQGIDILPDVIGYYFFYSGMTMLASESEHFQKGTSYAIIMMVLSVFNLYEAPAGGSIVGPAASFSPVYFALSVAGLILSLLTAYHLFRGIQEMAVARKLPGIEAEAGTRWTQILLINLATLLVMVLVVLPFLFILGVLVLFIAILIYTVKVLQFMQRCGEYMAEPLPDAEVADLQL
jgi:hypothetical protein